MSVSLDGGGRRGIGLTVLPMRKALMTRAAAAGHPRTTNEV
jgi:hypothetical protein